MTSYQNTLEHSVQATKEWTGQINNLMDWNDPDRSYRLLRATLHALRDVLPINESAQFSAQLPMMIRGLFYEGWRPSTIPVKKRDKASFIARIQESFSREPLDDPEQAIGAIFLVLNRHVSKGEIEDVRNSLQQPLREIWPPLS